MGNGSIKKYVLINAFSKYSIVIMNIFFSAALARILTPSDYGIVAVVTIFTTFFLRISDMGFGSAVIQRQDLNSEDVNEIYSFTFYIALILGLLFAALGVPISLFYKNSVYVPICLLLSVSVFFNTLNMIPNSVLLRDKLFKKVAVRNFLVNIIGFVAAILMALAGCKYYSLIAQSIIAAILNYLWNNHTAKLRFRFRSSFTAVKKVTGYSMFQFAFNWVNYFETNADNILIGTMMGSTPLAYYDKAYRLLEYPVGNLAGVITPVLHPVLKDYQNQKKILLKKYIDIQKILSLLSVIIVAVCFTCSREIIAIMFGSQWGNAVLAFQLLSISIYPKMLMSTSGIVYCSIGNTKLLFVAGVINAVNTVVWILMGICQGDIAIVALFVSFANWINMILTFSILISKGFKENVVAFFGKFAKDIAFMGIVTALIYIVSVRMNICNVWISFIVKAGIAVILYILYLCVTKEITLIIRLFKRN